MKSIEPGCFGRRVLTRGALVLLMLAAACASGPKPVPGPASSAPHVADDYYPLVPGWKWAYEVEKDGETILAVYAVLDRTGDTAVVQAGADRLTYAVSAEGIAQKDGTMVGDFVLRNPVALGGEWPVLDGKAKIVSVGQEVTVDAGRFTDCITVEVTRADPFRVTRTTFAPGVGPIALELQVQQAAGTSTTRAKLRGVTKPGEDPLGGVAPPP